MADESPFELRLSQAAYWAKCAAFVRMNRRPETGIIEDEQDNTIRDEGTAMHWVAQRLMDVFEVLPEVGDVAPNGVILTDDIIDSAAFYCEVLNSYALIPWRIEEQLAARRIHSKCGGTPDAFGHDLFKPKIILPDLKGGYRPVEVFPNPQLIGYLAAILDENPAWETPNAVVEFVIVQPRAYHRDGPVRTHTTRLMDVYPYIAELARAAAGAMGDGAMCTAGSQCDDCGARAVCVTCHAAGMRALEVAGEAALNEITVAAVDYELLRIEEAQRMLEARLTGLRAHAAHMIRRGETLPHFAIQSGKGRLDWIDDDAEQSAIAMGDLMGKNLRKREAAITPTQAANVIPRELIDAYAARKRGEAKLVRFDANSIAKAFSKLTLE